MSSTAITKRDLFLALAAALAAMAATAAIAWLLLTLSRPGATAAVNRQSPPEKNVQPAHAAQQIAQPTAQTPAAAALTTSRPAAPAASEPKGLPIIDLTGKSSNIALPGKIADLCVAAGGRMLVLRLEESDSLHVYDVASRKIAGTIPADDDPVCFATGRDKLVLGLWGQSAIQRWDLERRELDEERLVAGHDAPVGLAMGSNSNGPVLTVRSGGGAHLLDLQSLQPFAPVSERGSRSWKLYRSSQLRASADGRVFGAWDYQTFVAGVNVLTVETDQAKHTAYDDSVGHVCPNASGTHLFTAIGRWRVDERPHGLGDPPGFIVPAVNGPLFLRIQAGKTPQSPRFTLFTAGQPAPLASVVGLQFPGVGDVQVRRAFHTRLELSIPPDRRIMLIPEVNQIVAVSDDLRSLQYWPFDFARRQ